MDYEPQYEGEEEQITEEERQARLDAEAARIAELREQDAQKFAEEDAAEAAKEKPADLTPDQPVGRSAAKTAEEERAEEPEEPEEPADTRVRGPESRERFIETAQDVASKVGDFVQLGREANMAVGAGAVDYIIDTTNMLTGAKIPKYKKFETKYAESVREISSFVVPNLLLGAGATRLGNLANAKVGWGIGQSKLMQLIGKTGVDVGTGVIVDYTNTNSAEGDNLTGFLKQTFPKTFEWISDDIATLDRDSPDLKRKKSIYEGVGLGMFTALFEAAGVMAKGVIGRNNVTSLIPESESGEALIRRINEAADNGDLPEDAFTQAVKSTEDALDEIGAEQMSRAVDLDQPFFPQQAAEQTAAPTIKDTRGQGKFYHGAAQEFELVPGGQYGGEQNIYGAGLYVTDDFQTASTYKPKNRPKGQKKAEAAEQGVVYDVDMSKQNLFDLEQSPPEELINILRADRYDAMTDLIDSSLAEAGPNASIREIMDEIRRGSRSFEVPAYEIQEVFLELQDELKKQGYTGWQHIGGLKAGKGKRQHQVAIIFDPDETASISKVNPTDFTEQPAATGTSEAMVGVHSNFSIGEDGARSLDRGGVIGASVDAVRIQKNLNTRYGRLGSIITEAAKKNGLQADNLTKRMIVKQITDTIKKAGKYSAVLADGRPVNFEEIDAAGTLLAEVLVDPRMDSGMIKGVLDEYKDMINDLGKKAGVSKEVLGKTGYNAAMKAIKGYMSEFIDLDVQKASAYLATSMAGEMSDIAEGARYIEDTEAIARAQEMILDRMEYLMVEKGLAAYNWGASLNFLNTWKRFSNNPEILAKAGQNAQEQTKDALKNIVNRAKNSANSLREIAKSRPEFLVPLQMAWEFSDGNIDTLSKLHNWVNNSLGTASKAFIDLQPEIPSQIMQGAWANIYNSVLSAFSTPIKAFAGNTVLMLQKPISIFAGAAMAGDMKTIKRAAYQYMAVGDTFGKALKHMGTVYRKAAEDPTSVGYIMREELSYKNEATMDVLHSFAMKSQEIGEDGPMVLYNMAETMQDIANHPWLRFGANAMTALDGFTRATLANVEARGRVYDRMMKGGDSAMLTPGQIVDAENEVYAKMFDKNGMITDEAVDYASREIALNLDTDNVRSLSGIIQRAPFLKPFLMFPRTADNMIGMVNKFSPVSVFIRDYNKLALPGQKFSGDDMVRILQERGIQFDRSNIEQAFNQLRAEIRGRKAIGMASIMGAAYMFTQDRLHGNGHFDKERQKVRRQVGWKPRSFQGSDGKWYSYEFLGPMADFISVTADIMDNMDTIDSDKGEHLMAKMGFILGANLTNKSFLAGIEPMNDVLSGNQAAVARWSSNFASSLVPMSGFRSELGRLMSPELREVDQELFQLFHNRNKFIDVINPDHKLPTAFDWVDGRPVGYAEDFFTRFWNTYMPMKVADGITPERQFLIDIEFDSRPTFAKAKGGVDYTPEERSELFRLMGEQGVFRDELRRIMSNVDAQKWRDAIKAHREEGHKIDAQVYADLYYEVNRALRWAKDAAESELSNAEEIQERRYRMDYNEVDQRRGLEPTFPLQNR